MRLALRAGVVDVDAMLAGMSVEQLVEWQAFAQLEPFGDGEEEVRWATLCALMANLWSSKRSSPKDFMMTPDWAKPTPRRQTWQEIRAAMKPFRE